MGDVVNLDALIERNDFLAVDGPDAGQSGKTEISKTDLLAGESFYLTLRKPDFQRETAAWSPDEVCDFIRAFVEGDLVPSVICWQSPARLSFIIDGAHRVSAVIAWLSDDYGDGDHSIKFYGNNLSDEQRRIAKVTRELINKKIGSYKEIQAETAAPGSNPRLSERARALAHSRIPLLWIRRQESKKAEAAFLTINRSGVQIDSKELQILSNRFTPAAVAARAIVRNATGFRYWKEFSDTGQQEIEGTARSLYQALYSPPLQQPIRTPDLPIAGHGYGSQTLPLVYDLVNIANGFKVIDASKPRKSASSGSLLEETPESQRTDEAATIAAMRNTERLARMLTGMHASSLGLHPAIYFYAGDGKHQPTAVMAVAAMVKELSDRGRLLAFTKARCEYERFLRQHKTFVNQLTTFHGSMAKGYRPLRDYFTFVLDQFIEGASQEQVMDTLQKHDKYGRLINAKPLSSQSSKPFSQDLKQWKFLNDMLSSAFECYLCHGTIDNKSMQLDHVVDKSLGGPANEKNSAWTHPYCNSTYKAHLSTTSSGA